ncbi:hypothetical protein F8M41_008043 [Gigaspora margarita]|uniref:Uncharacterized protein n=1 Tax=Gigaspora margarita TaxID=4874 RepID=A0A8H4AVU3_GIGMA|nr:hypothetical protein F8M41_008043 [Gigaspora margarita]
MKDTIPTGAVEEAAQEKEIPDINAMLELEDLVIKLIRDPSKKVLVKVRNRDSIFESYQTNKNEAIYEKSLNIIVKIEELALIVPRALNSKMENPGHWN